ncbi:MAG: FixJ family two-component response regulator, partial [Myxococcota bacterium]
QMPKLGGEELASRLRRRQPDLPVLLMTGYVETATLQDLFGSGNIYFLRKPFSGEKLVDAVAELLNPPE